MYGLTLPNTQFIPTQPRYLPGMPESYTPPWAVQNLPQCMVQQVQTPDGRVMQCMPMHQMAMTPPPIFPMGNRMIAPPPMLTDPNAIYALPTLAPQQWMG